VVASNQIFPHLEVAKVQKKI